MASLPAWEHRVLQDVTPDVLTLWQCLTKHNQHWSIISDGSYCDNVGAYAWIIYDGAKSIYTSVGKAPGNLATAFRA